MIINGPPSLVKRATFAACVLDVWNFTLDLFWDEASYCELLAGGNFRIKIQQNLPKESLIRHVAHEVTHLRQYKQGHLRALSATSSIWKGEVHQYSGDDFDSDVYWLSPWEMEARAMEDYMHYKWRHRKRELH